MANVNDLELLDDPVEVNTDAMPEERAPRIPPPQPKDGYILQLPADLSEVWEVQSTNDGQRVQAAFIEGAVLKTFPDGQEVRAWISNRLREVQGVQVCDLAYLLRALGFHGPLKTNRDYVNALSQYGGHYFQCAIDWNARCNPNKDVYMAGQGRIEGKSGCGKAWATRAYKKKDGTKVEVIPRTDDGSGAFKDSFECDNCGALINVNVNLRNFKPAPKDE